MKEKIKNFEQKRKISLLCKLSLGENNISWDSLSNNPNSIIPFAFIAYLDGYLDLFDKLLSKYKIELCGHKDFIKRLKDRAFLDPDKDDELNQCNRPTSMLLELFAADYLSNHGEKILNLAAWTGEGIDIISRLKSTDNKYFTEVKYVGDDPKKYELSRNIGVNSGWTTSPATIYNYINMKIADSVFQFDKQKIPIKERRVFIFIHSHPGADITENWFNSKSNWGGLSWNDLVKNLNLSEEKSKHYLQNNTDYYHNKAGELRLFFIDNSLKIKKIITYNNSLQRTVPAVR